MSIIDILILLIILLYGIIGMKRGIFKELVITVGWILVFIIAFKLKDPLAEWFSLNLPFFNFGGAFKDVTVINVVMYQVLAFFIMYSLLMVVFNVVLYFTGVFEKLLNITIILGIPSKILGFFAGLVEGYVIVFVAIFILSQPFLNIEFFNESKLTTPILTYTPVLGNTVSNVYDSIVEIYDLRQEYSSNSRKDEFNRESVEIMLKDNMVQVDYIEKLVSCGKLKINGIEEIIEKYR